MMTETCFYFWMKAKDSAAVLLELPNSQYVPLKDLIVLEIRLD